ncbi:nicotinamidase, partial [Biomphalaria glabrata]
ELCSEAGRTVPGTVDCKGPTKTVAQKLWPDHCIANVTSGGTSSNFAKGLKTYETDIVVIKGDNCQ